MSQDIVKRNVAERMMDHWAIFQLIDWAAGKNGDKKTKTKLHDELVAVAADLAGPSPSSVEALLADAAATSWFAYRLHEARYVSSATGEGGMTLAQSEHAQRRIGSSAPPIADYTQDPRNGAPACPARRANQRRSTASQSTQRWGCNVKMLPQPIFAQALREWMNSDESGRNADRVAQFVIAKATSGHFAYFKLVIDLVDGKIRPSAEEELTFEADCVVVVVDDERDYNVSRAA